MRITSFALSCIFIVTTQLLFAQQKPLRVGIAGLTHGHEGWILGYKKSDIIELVGVAEPDRALAEKLSKQYGFSMDIVFSSLDDMLDKNNLCGRRLD